MTLVGLALPPSLSLSTFADLPLLSPLFLQHSHATTSAILSFPSLCVAENPAQSLCKGSPCSEPPVQSCQDLWHKFLVQFAWLLRLYIVLVLFFRVYFLGFVSTRMAGDSSVHFSTSLRWNTSLKQVHLIWSPKNILASQSITLVFFQTLLFNSWRGAGFWFSG